MSEETKERTITIEVIDAMCMELGILLEDKLNLTKDLADRQAQATSYQNQVIQEAYDSGRIEGPNKEARARAEQVYLDGDAQYQEFLTAQDEIQEALNECEIELKVLDQRVSLYRAFLYSLSNPYFTR